MIFAVAMLLAQPAVAVQEFGDRSVDTVTYQVIIPTPNLSPRETLAAQVLAETATLGSASYSRQAASDIAGGRRIEMYRLPDHLRYSITVDAEFWRTGLSVVEGTLFYPRFENEWVEAAAANLPIYRAAASVTQRGNINRADVLALYRRLFRTENLKLAVGGRFVPGEVSKSWQQRVADRPRPTALLENVPPEVTIGEEETGAPEAIIAAPPVDWAKGGAVALAATVALGTGKGSSLFAVAREKLRLSYVQESRWVPSEVGMTPELSVLSHQANFESRIPELREALVADIATWTPATLERAAGALEGSLDRGLPPGPFWFRPGRTLGQNLADRTYLAHYWQWKTGQDFSRGALPSLVREADLVAVQEYATRWVKEGKLTFRRGAIQAGKSGS
jgi:hypothetical protein